MIPNSIPFADELNKFFYEGMNRQTSVGLFGSAATGHWVEARSDLDLVVVVPKDKMELLGEMVRNWAWNPKLPILDGYALSASGDGYVATRLDEFTRVTFPSLTKIELIDQWNIKNRSKHLYGPDSITNLFPEISKGQLRDWAVETLSFMLGNNPNGTLPQPELVLSKLIWSVSWSARMLMLSRETICDSKRAALLWLASEYPEIGNLVNLLLDDYTSSDEMPASIPSIKSQ